MIVYTNPPTKSRIHSPPTQIKALIIKTYAHECTKLTQAHAHKYLAKMIDANTCTLAKMLDANTRTQNSRSIKQGRTQIQSRKPQEAKSPTQTDNTYSRKRALTRTTSRAKGPILLLAAQRTPCRINSRQDSKG